ncbi:MAG: autotransporter domain-containing protein [Xanthomonadales bacterium]|nr:autotransporter domain-containing protein [Xanthomonadales bacterium]
MKRNTLVILVLFLFLSADAQAFDVTPDAFGSFEGAQIPLTISIAAADWEINPNYCLPVVAPPGGPPPGVTQFGFTINISTAGTATWSNDQTSGDVSLDRGGQAFSLGQPIVYCNTSGGDFTDDSFSINLHTDTVTNEGTETVVLTLAGNCNDGSVGTVVCADSVTGNIDDVTEFISASITAPTPASEPGTPGNFEIVLNSPAPPDGLTINYSVDSSSTATSGLDYEPLSASVTIPVGVSNALIPVVVIDDDLVESSETVIVTLQSGSNYVLGSPASATVLINDDDVLPTASITATSGSEPANDGQFTITLAAPAPAAGLTVNYVVTSSSTATSGLDYQPLSSSVTIPFNASSVNIPVVVIDDDLVESSETVIVTLQSSSDYVLGSAASATVLINDDDVLPTASITATSGSEPANDGQFTITLAAPAPAAGLTVNYVVTSSSTATSGLDYQPLGSSVSFAGNATSANIPVLIINDEIVESVETVVVELQPDATYEIATPSTAVFSISDDDSAGLVVSSSSLVTSESGSSEGFSIRLTSQPEADVNISIGNSDPSEAILDKTAVVFNQSNWNIDQEVLVTGVDDDLDDGDVDLSITLSPGSNDANYNNLPATVVAVTNTDNDEAAAAVFSQNVFTVLEDVGAAEISIERIGATAERLVVDFETTDAGSGNSATAGDDYTVVNERLVWEADDTSVRIVEIPIFDDALDEEDEEVTLAISVEGSGLPVVNATLLIQSDLLEEIIAAINPDELPPNQKSIASAIIISCPKGEGQGGFQELCNDLLAEALEGGSVATALKQISPEESAAARVPATETVVVQNINVKGRLAALRAGSTGLSTQGFSFNLAGLNLNSNMFSGFKSNFDGAQPSFAAADSEPFADFGRWGAFISGRAVFGEKDTTILERGYSFDTTGLTFGIDYRFSNQLVGGFAIGYADNSVNIQGSRGQLETTGLTFTLYGSYYPTDNFYLDGSVNIGTNDYSQRRTINYQLNQTGVSVSEEFNTDYDGDQTGFSIGSGYDFYKNGWAFGPTLFVEFVDISIDSYEEKLTDAGGSGSSLGWAARINKQNYESLIPSIGFQFSKSFSRSWGVIVPQGRLSWAKELRNDDTVISGYFLGDAGQTEFQLFTDTLDEDFFKAGLGFSAIFQNNKSAFLMVDGDFGRELLSVYYISAGFRWEF